MSIKLKAFLRTIGLLVAVFSTAIAVNLLVKYFDADTVFTGMAVGLATWLLYCFYQANVSMLKSEERLKELSK